jgi:cysteine desulfurase/selenocysteine lyase
VSNATGAVLDVDRMVKMVRNNSKKAKILIDGAQSVASMKVDFSEMEVDFLAFSGHKMYGPMGIGGLLVRESAQKDLKPYLFGGGMISEVYLNGSSYGDVPDLYDAGTPNVAGAVGLAAAVKYLEKIGMEEVEKHGRELMAYALEKLREIEGLKIIGPKDANKRLGSVTFVMEGVHAHDVAQILDSQGIAVRSGHHCTMPLHTKMNVAATTRASFGIYNTREDVDRLVEGIGEVKRVFKI